jgi:hypothetical protein
LLRQDDPAVEFMANVPVIAAGVGEIELPIFALRKDGKRFTITLCGPLTHDHAADPAIRRLREAGTAIEVVTVNEWLVRGNLPAATRFVQGCSQR